MFAPPKKMRATSGILFIEVIMGMMEKWKLLFSILGSYRE